MSTDNIPEASEKDEVELKVPFTLFSTDETKKRKYILLKLPNKNKEKFQQDAAINIYNHMSFKWKLTNPKLILSVTGGAKQFSIDEETVRTFKSALKKTAEATNAWIITGGTDCGVMKLVGDAFKGNYNGVLLGIATWGILDMKQFPKSKCKVAKNEKAPEDKLNPNHTHFIFVDDGKKDKNGNPSYGAEIAFRTELENFITKKVTRENEIVQDIPMVLVVLEGGKGTLNTVEGALNKKVTVILISGTKGCADLVLHVWKNRETLKEKKDSLPSIISKYIKFPQNDQADIKSAQEFLEKIMNGDYDEFIKEFQIKEETENFESIVMDVIYKAEGLSDQLKAAVAIKINQYKIVHQIINYHINQIEIENTERDEFLNELLELALIENKPKFTNLILEYKDNSKLENFIEPNRYLKLYTDKSNDPFFLLIRKNEQNKCYLSYKKELDSLFKKCLGGLDAFFFNIEDFENNERGKSQKNKESENSKLFYWAVMRNRVEIAKIFWRTGDLQICNALIASRLFSKFTKLLPDLKEEMESAAKEFEELAIGVLKVFDKCTRDIINDVLILRYVKKFEMDVLELAVKCKCMNFVSFKTVQNVLERLWEGNLCTFFVIPYEKLDEIPKNFSLFHEMLIVFKGKKNDAATATKKLKLNEECKNNQITKMANYRSMLDDYEKKLKDCQARTNYTSGYRYMGINLRVYQEFIKMLINRFKKLFKHINVNEKQIFFRIPCFKFIIYQCFYMIFLLLFSYMMLFCFDLNVNEAQKRIDVIILVLIFAIFVEEIKQILEFFRFTKLPKHKRLKLYFKEIWNVLDFFGCILYFIGFILKIVAEEKEINECFILARILLSFDLSLWIFRALSFCLLSKKLGPILVMIEKMVKDLLYFLVIIGNFVFAAGITLQAILSPKRQFSWKVIFDVLNIAYWPLYGQVDILDYLKKCFDEPNTEKCQDLASLIIAFLILMVYMIISSILLLNILIAIFSSTHEKVQQNADIIWKNQRYQLILECNNYPILPIPFNLLYYFYYLLFKIPYKYLAYFCSKKSETTTQDNNFNNLSQQNQNTTAESDTLNDYEREFAEIYLRELNEENVNDHFYKNIKYNDEYRLNYELLKTGSVKKRDFQNSLSSGTINSYVDPKETQEQNLTITQERTPRKNTIEEMNKIQNIYLIFDQEMKKKNAYEQQKNKERRNINNREKYREPFYDNQSSQEASQQNLKVNLGDYAFFDKPNISSSKKTENETLQLKEKTLKRNNNSSRNMKYSSFYNSNESIRQLEQPKESLYQDELVTDAIWRVEKQIKEEQKVSNKFEYDNQNKDLPSFPINQNFAYIEGIKTELKILEMKLNES